MSARGRVYPQPHSSSGSPELTDAERRERLLALQEHQRQLQRLCTAALELDGQEGEREAEGKAPLGRDRRVQPGEDLLTGEVQSFRDPQSAARASSIGTFSRGGSLPSPIEDRGLGGAAYTTRASLYRRPPPPAADYTANSYSAGSGIFSPPPRPAFSVTPPPPAPEYPAYRGPQPHMREYGNNPANYRPYRPTQQPPPPPPAAAAAAPPPPPPSPPRARAPVLSPAAADPSAAKPVDYRSKYLPRATVKRAAPPPAPAADAAATASPAGPAERYRPRRFFGSADTGAARRTASGRGTRPPPPPSPPRVEETGRRDPPPPPPPARARGSWEAIKQEESVGSSRSIRSRDSYTVTYHDPPAGGRAPYRQFGTLRPRDRQTAAAPSAETPVNADATVNTPPRGGTRVRGPIVSPKADHRNKDEDDEPHGAGSGSDGEDEDDDRTSRQWDKGTATSVSSIPPLNKQSKPAKPTSQLPSEHMYLSKKKEKGLSRRQAGKKAAVVDAAHPYAASNGAGGDEMALESELSPADLLTEEEDDDDEGGQGTAGAAPPASFFDQYYRSAASLRPLQRRHVSGPAAASASLPQPTVAPASAAATGAAAPSPSLPQQYSHSPSVGLQSFFDADPLQSLLGGSQPHNVMGTHSSLNNNNNTTFNTARSFEQTQQPPRQQQQQQQQQMFPSNGAGRGLDAVTSPSVPLNRSSYTPEPVNTTDVQELQRLLMESQRKAEKLARHLVKTISEKKVLQDSVGELEQLVEESGFEVGRLHHIVEQQQQERCETAGVHAALRNKEKEVEMCETEIVRLQGAMDRYLRRRQGLDDTTATDGSTLPDGSTASGGGPGVSRRALTTSAAVALEEAMTEVGAAYLAQKEAEERVEQLTNELDIAVEQIQALDERLAELERAAANERVRAVRERSSNGNNSNTDGSISGDAAETIARLTAQKEELLFQNAESARSAAMRLKHIDHTCGSLRERLEEKQEELEHLRAECQRLQQEKQSLLLAGEEMRETLQKVKDDAQLVSEVVGSSRADADMVLQACAEAECLEAQHRRHLPTLHSDSYALVASSVERSRQASRVFAQQVMRDYNAIARFLFSLREMGIEESDGYKMLHNVAEGQSPLPLQKQRAIQDNIQERRAFVLQAVERALTEARDPVPPEHAASPSPLEAYPTSAGVPRGDSVAFSDVYLELIEPQSERGAGGGRERPSLSPDSVARPLRLSTSPPLVSSGTGGEEAGGGMLGGRQESNPVDMEDLRAAEAPAKDASSFMLSADEDTTMPPADTSGGAQRQESEGLVQSTPKERRGGAPPPPPSPPAAAAEADTVESLEPTPLSARAVAEKRSPSSAMGDDAIVSPLSTPSPIRAPPAQSPSPLRDARTTATSADRGNGKGYNYDDDDTFDSPVLMERRPETHAASNKPPSTVPLEPERGVAANETGAQAVAEREREIKKEPLPQSAPRERPPLHPTSTSSTPSQTSLSISNIMNATDSTHGPEPRQEVSASTAAVSVNHSTAIEEVPQQQQQQQRPEEREEKQPQRRRYSNSDDDYDETEPSLHLYPSSSVAARQHRPEPTAENAPLPPPRLQAATGSSQEHSSDSDSGRGSGGGGDGHALDEPSVIIPIEDDWSYPPEQDRRNRSQTQLPRREYTSPSRYDEDDGGDDDNAEEFFGGHATAAAATPSAPAEALPAPGARTPPRARKGGAPGGDRAAPSTAPPKVNEDIDGADARLMGRAPAANSTTAEEVSFPTASSTFISSPVKPKVEAAVREEVKEAETASSAPSRSTSVRSSQSASLTPEDVKRKEEVEKILERIRAKKAAEAARAAGQEAEL